MKRIEAENKGYQFTGSYSNFKEETKEEIQLLKASGIKAVIVPERSNQYGRSEIVGYSVYAEPKYFLQESLAGAYSKIVKQEDRMAALIKSQEDAMAELKKTFDEENAKRDRLVEELENYSF